MQLQIYIHTKFQNHSIRTHNVDENILEILYHVQLSSVIRLSQVESNIQIAKE